MNRKAVAIVLVGALLAPAALSAGEPDAQAADVVNKIEARRAEKSAEARKAAEGAKRPGWSSEEKSEELKREVRNLRVAEPKSLDEQVAYFEDALTEAIALHDWKMLELAAEGFKAAKVAGKDLEISVLRAERSAAWNGGGYGRFGGTTLEGQVEVWGWAAQALAGSTEALKLLKESADAEPPSVQPPALNTYTTQPEEYGKQTKEYTRYASALQRKHNALLVLALLNEPGVQKSALQLLHGIDKSAQSWLNGNYGAHPLVLAALASGTDSGWKGLLAVLDEPEEKMPINAKIHLLSSLSFISQMKKNKNACNAFTLEMALSVLLADDAQMQLIKPYTVLLKNLRTDDKNFSESLHILVNLAGILPLLPENAETLAELASLKTRIGDQGGMGQFVRQSIDQVLAKFRKQAEKIPKKPAPAPDGDF